MEKSVRSGNQASHYLGQDPLDLPDEKDMLTLRTPEQSPLHCSRKNNVVGLSDDLRFKQLSAENQRLKTLVEDLMVDKFSQAQRITELNDEKARLKKVLADLILNDRN